ncbi:MAG: recombinase family protein [Candidatus Omnitrophica bacterium]|nr:recombinase family protein [Candidatus Omnitrophota bacterium]
MKAIIYARCSTDEIKQDVEVQLKELRRYCDAYGWQHDEVFEYCSGYKGDQPKLAEVIEKIRLKHYDVMLVHSIDRFSREHPSKTDETLNRIVHLYKCRFISLAEGIDSEDDVKWHIVRHLFTYFANMFSRNLSIKVKNGIKNKKDKGLYSGGRPKKDIDYKRLLDIKGTGLSVRKAVEAYNSGLPRKMWISKSKMAQALSAQIAEQGKSY